MTLNNLLSDEELKELASKNDYHNRPILRGCVFCGSRPSPNVPEHIIPMWAINKSGDPKRSIYVGRKFDYYSLKVTHQSYSFNSLKFPSCQSCNNVFSTLEDRAATVFQKLIDSDTISTREFHTFFDWADKIRIGAWLMSLFISGNPLNIRPKFRISSRIAKHDTAIWIGRLDGPSEMLSFQDLADPVLWSLPNYFSFYLNGVGVCIYSRPGCCQRFIHEKCEAYTYSPETGMYITSPDTTKPKANLRQWKLLHPRMHCLLRPRLLSDFVDTRDNDESITNAEHHGYAHPLSSKIYCISPGCSTAHELTEPLAIEPCTSYSHPNEIRIDLHKQIAKIRLDAANSSRKGTNGNERRWASNSVNLSRLLYERSKKAHPSDLDRGSETIKNILNNQ